MTQLAKSLDDLPAPAGTSVSENTKSLVFGRMTRNNMSSDPLQLVQLASADDYDIDDDIDPRDDRMALTYAMEFTRGNRGVKKELNKDLKGGSGFPVFSTVVTTLLGSVATGPASVVVGPALASVGASQAVATNSPEDVLARDNDEVYLLERLGSVGSGRVDHSLQLWLVDPYRREKGARSDSAWVIHEERHTVIEARDDGWL